MLFKLVGGTMVILASSFLGWFFAKDCGRRPNALRDLQGLLQMFENEISFLSNLLTDAFTKLYKSMQSDVTLFFSETVRILAEDSGLSASQAWGRAVKENIRRTALNREDEEILVSFGNLLGNSDLEGQIKNIRLTLNQLKMQEQKAEESKRKNETMYRVLGVLSGLAVVIVLF